MSNTHIKSKWVSGNLYFYDKSGNVLFYMDGTNRKMVFPSGATLDIDGTLEAALTGNTTGINLGNVTTYAASGAIALTDKLALLDGTAGALAMTLADGGEGQVIQLKCTDATNNCVVTPANLADGTTLTFDAAGEVCILQFDGTNWQVIYNTSTLA